MRSLPPFILLALCGCGGPVSSSTAIGPLEGSAAERTAAANRIAEGSQFAAHQANFERAAAETRAVHEKTGLASRDYWNRCRHINKQFITEKSDLWLKSFRPEAVGATCVEAATRLRSLAIAGVDLEVIDHVNRVIRGYETLGSIAKVKGRESLLRNAGDTLKFIYAISRKTTMGAVADGGWFETGVGLFPGGRQSTTQGQDQTARIAMGLINSEEAVINHIRKEYGIELRPW